MNLTSTVLTQAKTLSNLRDKYQNAASTITAICAECSSISASLSQIQNLLVRDSGILDSHLTNRPELRETFDTALTGCEVVYACLEEEIQRLCAGAHGADAMTWRVRCRFIWREDTMRDLLSQLRGQQMALNLLIQMLQLESLSELKQLMRDNNAMISKVAQRSRSLRETHPRIRVSSIFSADRESTLGRSSTIASTIASTIDQTEFEFDDTIVNSRAYRRALAAAQKRPGTAGTAGRSVSEPTVDAVPDIGKLDIGDTSGEVKAPAVESEQDEFETSSISTEKNVHGSSILPEAEATEDRTVVDQSDSAERKSSVGAISMEDSAPTERKLSQDRTSTESPVPAGEKEDRVETTSVTPIESPRSNPPRVQRKPLPSGRHILMPSASMSTLSSNWTAEVSHDRKDSADTISRVSTATTVTPSIFSTGSNPATNSSISLPDTIDSASEPDDNDAETLVEQNSPPGAASHTLPPDEPPETTNPELQTIASQLSMSETSYLSKLNILRTFIEEPISRRWPDAWSHFPAFHSLTAIRSSSATHLQHATAAALARTFRAWLASSRAAYTSYFQQHPHTAAALRARREADPAGFGAFLDTFASTHNLDDLLRTPLRRFHFYCQTASRAAAAAPKHAELRACADELAGVKRACDGALAAAQRAAGMAELRRRIEGVQPAYAEGLGLGAEERRLVRQEAVACKANGKGAWKPVKCVLLDNYLFFGRWERSAGAGAKGAGTKGAGEGQGGWYRKGMVGMKGGGGAAWWYLEKVSADSTVFVVMMFTDGVKKKSLSLLRIFNALFRGRRGSQVKLRCWMRCQGEANCILSSCRRMRWFIYWPHQQRMKGGNG